MDTNIDSILSRILSGRSTTEDLIIFSEWINRSEENKNEFSKLKAYWDAEVSFKHSMEPNLKFDNIASMIKQAEVKKKRIGIYRKWIAAASVSLLLTVSSIAVYRTYEKYSQSFYTYMTDERKSTFVMNDGTEVTLNKNSRLIFSSRFGEKNRNVTLQGEAYFKVAKDSARPFEVKVSDCKIRVLGTEFNLKENLDSKEVVATLVTGSVCFENKTQQVEMKPNQQLIFSEQTGALSINEIGSDLQQYTDWHTDLLRYKSIEFMRLISDLEKYYKVSIVVNNPSLKKNEVSVSGTFDKNQNIEQILKVIARSVPIRWQNNDGTYYIN